MQETFKTNKVRGKAFLEKYFSGKVVDIGCGANLVVPHAEPFDKAQGDANKVLDYLTPNSYDCVHSSHCLEHTDRPADVMSNWWALVKPGGYLVVVVPHEDLYEQGVWPSRFNGEHKCTFRLKQDKSWSSCSFDLYELVNRLPDVCVLSAEVQDHEYDYGMQRLGSETVMATFLRMNINKLYKHLSQKKLISMELLYELNRFFFQLGATVDQTLGPALAQIQVVAQKQGK